MLPSSAMLGSGNARSISHLINCRTPYAIKGYQVAEWNSSCKGIEWDPQRADEIVELIGPRTAQGGCRPTGYEFLHDLPKERFAPLRVRAFLLKYQHLVPYTWQDYEIHFPGTVYVNREGAYVIGSMYLEKRNFEWRGRLRTLDERWKNNAKALLISS